MYGRRAAVAVQNGGDLLASDALIGAELAVTDAVYYTIRCITVALSGTK